MTIRGVFRRLLRLMGIHRKYKVMMMVVGKPDPRLTSVMTAEMLERLTLEEKSKDE